MKEILDVIHKTIYQFFDVCDDDEEVPISDKDKLLLEVNKSICNNLEALEKEPCEDVIDRAEAMTEIMMFAGNVKSDEEGVYIKVSDVVQLLRELPPVTPQPKTGHWIYIRNSEVNGLKIVECSECGKRTYGSGNYCPTCGIKMESSEKPNKSEIQTGSEGSEE